LFITDSTFASSACFSYRGELLPLTCAYAREKFWCSYQTIRVSYYTIRVSDFSFRQSY